MICWRMNFYLPTICLISKLSFRFHVSYVIFVFVAIAITPIFVHAVYAEEKNSSDLVLIPETIKITDSSESTTPKAGDSISITIDVQNIGNRDAASAQFRLEIIDDQDAVVFESSNEAELKVGQTTTMKYDWMPSMRGTYKIVFDADSADNVIESNEANNHYEMAVKVIANDSVLTRGVSSDGSINVDIESDPPKAGTEMFLYVTFTGSDGKKIKNINYAISGTQDGVEVISAAGAYEPEGEGLHISRILDSDTPVDMQVTILGIGLPYDEASWTGPKDEIVSLHVIPEFPVVLLVFTMTVGMIVVFTAKTRLLKSNLPTFS